MSMKLAIAMIGMLAAMPVRAQYAGKYDLWQSDAQPPMSYSMDQGVASYQLRMGRRSALFGSVGVPGDPALGPPASYSRRFTDLENPRAPQSGDRLDFQGAMSQVFTLGYRWRNVQFEGSAFSAPPQDERRIHTESLKLASRSGRLSFSPVANLALQFSRGTLSSFDQLEPSGEVRRTSISATYKRDSNNSAWQTTLAWGRNARPQRESRYGYLVESSLRLASAHAFFGRVEQVGSDDILRENESSRREMFKMNKLTLGYVYDLRPGSGPGMDVGAMMSRHLVPSAMSATYGHDPVAYMMFVRLKLE
jgi:hypothetical protein